MVTSARVVRGGGLALVGVAILGVVAWLAFWAYGDAQAQTASNPQPVLRIGICDETRMDPTQDTRHIYKASCVIEHFGDEPMPVSVSSYAGSGAGSSGALRDDGECSYLDNDANGDLVENAKLGHFVTTYCYVTLGAASDDVIPVDDDVTLNKGLYSLIPLKDGASLPEKCTPDGLVASVAQPDRFKCSTGGLYLLDYQKCSIDLLATLNVPEFTCVGSKIAFDNRSPSVTKIDIPVFHTTQRSATTFTFSVFSFITGDTVSKTVTLKAPTEQMVKRSTEWIETQRHFYRASRAANQAFCEAQAVLTAAAKDLVAVKIPEGPFFQSWHQEVNRAVAALKAVPDWARSIPCPSF